MFPRVSQHVSYHYDCCGECLRNGDRVEELETAVTTLLDALGPCLEEPGEGCIHGYAPGNCPIAVIRQKLLSEKE